MKTTGTALLIVDLINNMDFEVAENLLAGTRPVLKPLDGLKHI